MIRYSFHNIARILRLRSRVLRVLAGATACLLAPGVPAQSGVYTTTAELPVTLEIAGSCQVRTTDLDFGNYNAASPSALLGQTAVQVTCTQGLNIEIGLGAGQGGGGNVQDRRMSSGADTLRYGLYQDAARRVNWGNTSGVDTTELQGSGREQVVTIFGQIPARQQVAPGRYGDTIVVHVYY